MKIAMVSEHASPLAVIGGVDAGGQNIHVAALASTLVRRGHDVTVFTRRDALDLPERVTTLDGYVVEHVPAGPPTEVPKDELLPHMKEFAAHLSRRWSAEPFDVAHAHFWMSGLAATEAAGLAKVPVVQTFHALGTVKRRHQGSKDTSPPDRIACEERLCADVDHVIATCSDEVEELAAMGLSREKVSVVPCGVDLSRFRPNHTSPALFAPPRLLAVGRLVERKGLSDVVEALVDLPGVELVVAGGPPAEALMADPEANRVTDQARANGTADRVRFIGCVDQQHMPDLYATADLVVAVPWYEPFGIVPVEAMACARPVVGSAVGGLLDTVVPGETGELVPPRDPARLAAVVRDLLGDRARRETYGRAGVERVRSRYGWDTVAGQTEDVYTAVARAASAHPAASHHAR
ncbi:glycosyltransferase family 1 protein [Phytoactinopolyspora alkaliphila]|uniref:Glycosyltransferase family 1 protein n=1 Tax=Phytoactinopolyspora alkaliphila TaxID=1783498 RepID=A0A6N9YLX6_9ACTN|nr:glycosyltransferase [Phytoactinopolyspora alkaliphila]NED95927.1 glycosyltransferase family 1 protein [Phytoactinopolyspora alkaliphila]